MMKKEILLLICFTFMVSILQAQTTFTFTGTGNWTDPANWSPSFPGTMISAGDTAIISEGSTATVPNGNGLSILGSVMISGTLINNAFSAHSGNRFQEIFQVTTTGTFQNNGTFFNNGFFLNNGTFENLGNGMINNDGNFVSNETLITTNTIRNRTGATMGIRGTSEFINTASQGIINESGAQLNLSGFFLRGIINNSGNINANSARILGTLTNNDGAMITTAVSNLNIGSGGHIINDGTLAPVTNFTINNGGLLTNNATFTINTNQATVFGALVNTATGVITNNATLLIAGGDLTNNGIINNNAVLDNSGSLLGTNLQHNGDFLNSTLGNLYPGNGSPTGPIGTYTFNNNFELSSGVNSRTFIDIGGATTPGTDYDQVVVGGNATLAGRLLVTLAVGYEPQGDETFTILTAANITGTFDELILPVLSNGEWQINYTPTSAVLSVLSGCSAVTTTYTGSGGDNGWDNGIPDATTNAIIAANYDTGAMGLGDITACELIIHTGATLTITDGNTVSVENDMTVNGTLQVSNEGSLVQVNENAVTINNGTITVSKTTPTLDDRNFVAMSSPVTAEARDRVYGNSRNVYGIVPSNFVPFVIDFMVFPEFEFAENFLDDNGDYLLEATGSDPLPIPGIGQLVFPQPEPNVGNGAYTLTYSQNPSNPGTLNSGTITVPIHYNGPATTNNYNLLGNPYASAIDVTAFINANDAVNEVYYWDHITNPTSTLPGFGTSNFSMNDVSLRNAMMGIAAVNGGTAPGQFMASGQGFGIKADQAEMMSNTPVVFTNSIRVTGNNDGFRSSETPTGIDKLWLNLTTTTFEEAIAQTGIGFTPNATSGIDKGYDSPRVGTFLSLFTTLDSGELLGIQGREAFDVDMEITLGFSTSIEETAQYTISISNFEGIALENTPVFLIDHLLNTIVNLKDESYTFTAQKGLHTDRFTVVFQDREVLGVDGESFRESGINLYPNPSQGQVTLAYTGTSALRSAVITDINGKIIKRIDLTNFDQSRTMNLNDLARGMYFINITSQENMITKKLILR